jgi:hypothetical protein
MVNRTSRTTAIVILHLLVVLVTQSSCGTRLGGCGSKNCPQATSHLELTSGTATLWALDGSEATLPIVPEITAQVAPGSCQLRGRDLQVLPDNMVNGFLYLICNAFGDVMDTFLFGGKIIDPRQFDASTTQALSGWGECGKPDNTAGTIATIATAVATGSAADYPAMVTPDFRRSYTVELDTGAVDCNNNTVPRGCPICQKVMRMRVSFTIEQTAANYFYTQNGICICE